MLKQAKELVKVDYEPLEPVRTIQEARAADAPSLHPNGNLCQQRHVTRGDARAALAQSKYVVTQSYRTPFTEHAFLEPECAVAFPYKDGVKVYTSDQGVYDTRKEISIMLGWEPERIVVENKLVGGGFGGKEDVSVQHLAVLAAPPGEPAREGKAHPAGVHQLPPQAPLYGGHLHPGLRRERHLHRPGLRDPLRHWGLRLPVRAGAGAGLHPLGGPLLLPEHRHPRLRLVHQQPPAGAFRGSACARASSPWSPTSTCWRKVGISPGRSASATPSSRGKALPNGQIADCSTALKETPAGGEGRI